jgi:hypothetical protein
VSAPTCALEIASYAVFAVGKRLAATLALALVAMLASAAHASTAGSLSSADALSASDYDRLLRGDTVVFKQSLQQDGRRYVGGVAYAVVEAHADDLASLIARPDGWQHVLPRTRSVRWMGSIAGDRVIEMTHGTALLQAKYSLRFRRSGRSIRFWMDPAYPHDIEDAWGFVRTQDLPGGRTLVAYGVLIDMGPGLLRDLFEGTVLDAALTVPQRVRGWLLERSAQGRRASR